MAACTKPSRLLQHTKLSPRRKPNSSTYSSTYCHNALLCRSSQVLDVDRDGTCSRHSTFLCRRKGIEKYTHHYSTFRTNVPTPLHGHQLRSKRHFTIPTLACVEYTPTLFGLTPLLLSTFHSLSIPYWGGIALTNILVRSSMIPLVIQGAKTSVGIGVVAPEVQYLITNFRNDFAGLKQREEKVAKGGGTSGELRKAQYALVRYTVESLRGIFKLHKVNLLDVFKSPMLQIPVFWYFALDLRYIINGADPQLAQALVDTTFLHITDLTEPDPYYALPIATGALLYFNVETAVGRKALSGETSSQSKLALIMKDFFQSLAIFMPCFMVQQPSGVQIYLMTSMVFSLCQSMALRNDGVREAVGLPPMYSKPKGMEEGKFVKEFMEMMKERQEAKARGEFILGEGVLKLGGMPARVGKKRKSSIEVVQNSDDTMKRPLENSFQQSKVRMIELPMYTLHSLLVAPEQFATRPTPMLVPSPLPKTPLPSSDSNVPQFMPEIPLSVMEAANRGEKLSKVEMAPKELLEQSRRNEGPIDVSRLKMKRDKQRGKSGKKGR
ncbi:hypothetical protein HJC23_013439 [Cyclotella cryptica]|uniref:Uncharacterized protein n=1 Tax=Cyclotella cryptica TaxID=29204 RepID=A0ABD3NZG9_9STRA